MKSHERSDTVAVGCQAMTCYAYYLSAFLLKESIVCHVQSYNKKS